MNLTILICVHSVSDFHDDLLHKSLISLCNQTYKNFKTIIVLDGCWNNTEIKILSSKYDLDLTILKKDKKQNLSHAKNFGLNHINTEWVGFLDADDLYLPTKLEKQVKFIENNTNIDFLGTKSWYINGLDENNYFPNWYLTNIEDPIFETHEQIKNQIFKSNILTHGSIIAKKKCIDVLGGYNNIRGMEDWDLWKRAILSDFKFHQLSEKLYVYRKGTSVPL